MNAAMKPSPLLVGMVEDDPHYSAGVIALLHGQPDVRVVANFDAATPMLAQAQKAHRQGLTLPWDLLLMDLGLPDMDGIEATRQLKALFPRSLVIVVTVFEEPLKVLAAICAGADGYLLKTASAQGLLTALATLREQGAPLSSRIAATLIEFVRKSRAHHAGPPLPRDLGLSPRELEVLRNLVDGLGYREIGERMDISTDTVRTHIRHIYANLQVHSVGEAVAFALRHGVV